MIKRPLLLISLSFMIGIILNESIVWTALFAVLFLSYFVVKNEYKLLVLLISVPFFIGNGYVRIYEFIHTYEIEEYNGVEAKIVGTVYEVLNDKTYLVKNVWINDKKIKSNVRITSKDLEFGDKIQGAINLKIPDLPRNSGGFNYRRYLKTQEIYLTGVTQEIKIIGKNQLNFIEEMSEKFREKVRNFTENTLDKETSGILQALIVGDDSDIDENIEEEYKKAGMVHLLVVSGGHVSFLIMLVTYVLEFVNVGRNKSKYIMILIIVMYIFITGCTPSVLRAGIATIIITVASLIGRPSDTLTTIGLVALILILENPYTIYSLSFELSFIGAIGIILGYPKLNGFISKFIPNKIAEAVSLTLSAQLFVTPVTLYNFNTMYLGGLISNIFSMSLAGIIMMYGIILFPIYLFIPPFGNLLAQPLGWLINIMNKIANIFSNIPGFNYMLPTPKLLQIVIYYVILFWTLDIDGRIFLKRITNLPQISRKNLYNKLIIVACGIMSILIINFTFNILPKPLEIAMIDVGHGDSILITTPHRKSILIDTGDSYVSNGKRYDMGEKTVLPYILDKGISKIDFLILSHLDSDHIGGFNYIIDNIKVDMVGISINNKVKEKGGEIEEIIEKNSKKIYLKNGKKFSVDGVKFTVLAPKKVTEVFDENNDSIVVLMEYQGIKALFMGDMESEAEKELIKNTPNLDVDILKLGHHGSITSTTDELVKATTPKVSLISVGTRFKSIPSDIVLNRLRSVNSKVYRTDKMGEVIVKISNGKLYAETKY